MATIPPEAKMRLYDKFFNWVAPMKAEEARYYNQERRSLQEYERLLAAEAERVELENREIAARVALVEEANQRERDKIKSEQDALNGYHIVARAEFSLEMNIGAERVNVTTIVTLESTDLGKRRARFSVVRTKNNSVVQIDTTNIQTFLKTRPSYELYITPWLNGKLESKDLRRMEGDDCFRSISFAGGKIPG